MARKTIIFLIAPLFILAAGALTALAEETSTSNTAAKQVDFACVKAAAEKRETAIQSAFNKFSSSINSALQTRKSDVSNAWSITDTKQRNAAIKTTWENFKKSKQDAIKTHRTEQLAAWEQFKKDRKACNSGPTGENQGADISF